MGRRRPGRLFVTGGAGLVGRHVVRAARAAGWEIVSPPSSSLDITARARVIEDVAEWKPDAVVHLAYRRDDRRTIVDGSANVASAAAAVGARLVHVSTDVVFGGRPQPYTEADAPDPVTDYGTWKVLSEHAVAAAHPTPMIVRTSLVYSTSAPGPAQRDVEAAVTGRSSIAFFTDEVRCPVHADDLAAGLVALAGRPESGILHLGGPSALSRADLARLLAAWMHLDVERVPVSSLAASGQVRPGHVVLDSSAAGAFGLSMRSPEEALRVVR